MGDVSTFSVWCNEKKVIDRNIIDFFIAFLNIQSIMNTLITTDIPPEEMFHKIQAVKAIIDESIRLMSDQEKKYNIMPSEDVGLQYNIVIQDINNVITFKERNKVFSDCSHLISRLSSSIIVLHNLINLQYPKIQQVINDTYRRDIQQLTNCLHRDISILNNLDVFLNENGVNSALKRDDSPSMKINKRQTKKTRKVKTKTKVENDSDIEE